MSFSDWKKNSVLFNAFKSRAERYGIGYEEVSQAAYKAGERAGIKKAKAQLEAAEAKLRELKWQPIETAPKEEGAVFLAYGLGNGTRPEWPHIVEVEVYELRYVDEYENALDHLTYWMPLIQAPKQEEK